MSAPPAPTVSHCLVNPPSSPPADAPLLVACFCARWCRLCDDYHAVFDAARHAAGAASRFAWIDIEDDEQLLGPVDIVDFPTLLIVRGEAPLFFGPLTPQPATLARLLRSARSHGLGRLDDATIDALAARIRGAVGHAGD